MAECGLPAVSRLTRTCFVAMSLGLAATFDAGAEPAGSSFLSGAAFDERPVFGGASAFGTAPADPTGLSLTPVSSVTALAPVPTVAPTEGVLPTHDGRNLIATLSRLTAPNSATPLDFAAIRSAAGMDAISPSLAPKTLPTEGPMATGDIFDLRLGLVMLSRGQKGGLNDIARQAQGNRGDRVLAMSGGLVTLASLRAAIAESGLAPVDGPLRVPVVLMPDTTLRLTAGETLEMSRTDGAFMMSFGRVEVLGASLAATGSPNPHVAAFAPVLIVAGQGSLLMQGATVTGLGFGDSTRYAGVAVMGQALRTPIGRTSVRDTVFRDSAGLVIEMAPDPVITNNHFVDMRSAALRLITSSHAIVRDNHFSGEAPTNAIRILSGSVQANLSGNVLLGGTRVGILVSDSYDAVVTDNLIWNRDGGGVKLQHASCGLVVGNTLLRGRQKGVEVRASEGVRVTSNLLVANRSGGIWISAQSANAHVGIDANRLRANGAGFVGATAGRLELRGNDLMGQLPRLADGDLVGASNDLARDLTGSADLTVQGAVGPERPAAQCGETDR